MPPYELSEIAQQKKEERRLAQIKRANQTQKKQAALPTREHVPLAANSVAARRLAAKRSGMAATGSDVIGSVPHPGYSAPGSSAGGADFFFDDSKPISSAPSQSQSVQELDLFGGSSVSTAPVAASSHVKSNADLFDPFSTSAPVVTPAPTSHAQAPVDLFGSGDLLLSAAPQAQQTQKPQPSNTFDAFGGSNSLLTDMSFSTAPPPTIEEKAKNVLNLFDSRPPAKGPAMDPYASLVPSGPNVAYGQPRPMVPPAMYGGMPPQGGMMMPPQGGMPSMVRQQQPARPQERDPFGSLGGFDSFKK